MTKEVKKQMKIDKNTLEAVQVAKQIEQLKMDKSEVILATSQQKILTETELIVSTLVKAKKSKEINPEELELKVNNIAIV